MFTEVAETLSGGAGQAPSPESLNKPRKSRRGCGWPGVPDVSGKTFGVVQSWLTVAATGAARAVSWNRPWKIRFAWAAVGVG